MKAENDQWRHSLNSYWFSGQSAGETTGHRYVQVFAIEDGGPPCPAATNSPQSSSTARGDSAAGSWQSTKDSRAARSENPHLRSEARPGAGLEDIKGRIDVGCDRWTVATHHLPERAGDVRADNAGREDFLGEDDAVHQVCCA